eukprot:TRINITY_DN5338_c0_g1_i5.p7 TRINITY_DN5338_c0_g1~~TRINITY_DN5338_c0_g1_i5.p7  ORF type:complete len:115 (+),score=3.72 TRINITY_DN5338_c0_g1_i5:1128-1472(+)
MQLYQLVIFIGFCIISTSVNARQEASPLLLEYQKMWYDFFANVYEIKIMLTIFQPLQMFDGSIPLSSGLERDFIYVGRFQVCSLFFWLLFQYWLVFVRFVRKVGIVVLYKNVTQ